MISQVVRYQRQGWRPSLHAQVGQPAGDTTDKHLLRKTTNSKNLNSKLKPKLNVKAVKQTFVPLPAVGYPYMNQ